MTEVINSISDFEKYLKNTKKINNTLWLDKLINQLEKKSKGV